MKILANLKREFWELFLDKGEDRMRFSIVVYNVAELYWKMEWSLSSNFYKLGSGSFASVFAWESRGCIALKQAAAIESKENIHKEFENLTIIYQHKMHALAHIVEFVFPEPFKWYESFWDFAQEMRIDRSIERGLEGVTALYTMQRLWPIPPALATTIRSLYFPAEEQWHDAPAFIARIYLGQKAVERSAPTRFFNYKNFPLSEDKLRALDLDVHSIAAAMGRSLACIHFRAGLDARDVEFVLGGDAVNPYQKHALMCIDFNQVRRHSFHCAELTDAILDNDKYFPLPSSSCWQHFVDGYMAVAHTILLPADPSTTCTALAMSVIEAIRAEWENPRRRTGGRHPDTQTPSHQANFEPQI